MTDKGKVEEQKSDRMEDILDELVKNYRAMNTPYDGYYIKQTAKQINDLLTLAREEAVSKERERILKGITKIQEKQSEKIEHGTSYIINGLQMAWQIVKGG
jgi:hypothetical protein